MDEAELVENEGEELVEIDKAELVANKQTNF